MFQRKRGPVKESVSVLPLGYSSSSSNIISSGRKSRYSLRLGHKLRVFFIRFPRKIEFWKKKVIFTFIFVFFLIYGIVLVYQTLTHLDDATKDSSDKRIAIIIPFLGHLEDGNDGGFPPFLDVFLSSVAGSSSLVDFILILSSTGTKSNDLMLQHIQLRKPSNVKLKVFRGESGESGLDALATTILRRLVSHRKNLSKDDRKLITYYREIIKENPYALVEIKPALGFIFEDTLKEFAEDGTYSHWGYSDLDIMFGDVPRWVDEDELNFFDIVTFGFGDQDRLYLRGQFTFMKNNKNINTLWRQCRYLSEIDIRLARALDNQVKNRLHFESAEGCFSAIVLSQDDINVKYAVKAFTDVKESRNSANKQSVYLSTGHDGNKSIIFKAKHGEGITEDDIVAKSMNWFENDGSQYSSENTSLQRPKGEMIRINRAEEETEVCMYWAPKKYQHLICVPGIDWYDNNVFLLEGVLYKQKYESIDIPTGLETAPFFHYQEWKRTYRESQLVSFKSREGKSGWALVKEGAIPIPMLTKSDGPFSSMVKTNTNIFPHNSFCLVSTSRKYPPGTFSTTCKRRITWENDDGLHIVHPPKWNTVNVWNDITLSLTMEIKETQEYSTTALQKLFSVATTNILSWSGPTVLVVHMSSADKESLDVASSIFSDVGENTFIAIVFSDDNISVSRKALINMANSVSPTRWIMNGIQLERGMLLSDDAYLFAKRATHARSESTGHVLLFPSLAMSKSLSVLNGSEEMSLVSIGIERFQQIKNHLSRSVAKFDCKSECESDSNNELEKLVYEYWLEVTTNDILKKSYLSTEAAFNIEQVFLDMISSQELWDNIYYDYSPGFIVDRLGPVPGMYTMEIVPEVEEFAGSCFNLLNLSQLAALGYEFNMLPGIFALSDPVSRSSARGCNIEVPEDLENCCKYSKQDHTSRSRCDGCSMLQDEDLLWYLAREESYRSVKTALIWEKLRPRAST